MSNIEKKFEQWGKKLYDISKRNYMINFTGQHYRSIKLTSPDMEKLYNLLVVDEKTLTFKRSVTRDNNYYVFAIATLLNSLGSDFSFKEGDIDTSTYKNRDSYDVLRNIKRVSNDFKLEQGIDVLHITFGYVRWKPLGSNDYYKTPLINVPVALEQENINSLYSVSKVGDIELNPIFKYMLEKQGIKLPELNDKSLQDYLKEIDDLANENGWEVIYEAALCILFFQKMVMFKDLESNKEKIINHPILKTFCDDVDSYIDVENLTFNHDLEDERNRLLVVEADSSQMDALSLASSGKSFVLQGPPGTGKSQTITNIIAQAIGQGKKVLFVSQKTAALEVVYNKLKQANLEDFTLALHNTKFNKAKVVNDIYAPYNLKKTIVKEDKLNDLERMQFLKQDINKYAKSINQKVYHLDMNFYDVIDNYYKYVDAIDGNFIIPSVINIKKGQLNNILANIRVYEEQYNDYKQKSNSCYDYTTIKSLTFDEKDKLESSLQKAYDNISEVIETLDNINYYIPDFYTTYKESLNTINDLKKLLTYSVDNTNNIYNNDILNQLDKISELLVLKEVLNTQKIELSNVFNASIFQENLSSFVDNINNIFVNLSSNSLYFNNHNSRFMIENIFQYKVALNDLIKLDNQKENVINYLCTLLNVSKEQLYLLNKEKAINVLKEEYDTSLIELSNNTKLELELNNLLNKQNEINNQVNTILTYAHPSILDIDINAINNYKYILSEQVNSFALLFNSAKRKLREDVVETIGIHLKINVKANNEKVASILELLSRYHQIKNEYNVLLNKLKENYNFSYNIDLNSLISSLTKTQNLVNCFDITSLDNVKIIVSNKTQALDYLESLSTIENRINKIKKTYLFSNDSSSYDDHMKLIKDIIDKINTIKLYFHNPEDILNIEKYYILLKSYQKNYDIFEDSSNLIYEKFKIHKEDYQNILDSQKAYKEYKAFADKYELEISDLINTISKNKYEISCEINKFNEIYFNSLKDYEYISSLFTKEKKLDEYNNENLLRLIEDCYNNISSLKAKFAFETNNKEFENDEHIKDFIRWCKEENVKGDLCKIYLRKFYLRVILSFIYDNDILQSLEKVKLEAKINEFNNLCKEQLEISKAIIRSNCLDNIPSLKTNLTSNDERSYLLREYQRSRKQSIRKLFDNIPHLLMSLKPCLMMSPLTVSNYLENDNYFFDLVVFDEASQIRPEEAIGSIYRGKQVIIAGDSKQLPPTNFFNKKSDDIDEDEEDDYLIDSVDESILEYAIKKLPTITLLWHYRSKNENLIAFSNKHFYTNSLITFPSVKKSCEDFGVEYILVNGIYHKNKRIANDIEAERVIDIIDEHIEKYGTSKSLGVIAFGERQRYTIEKALLEYRKEKLDDKRFEEFFSNELKEPFFVKNIENVQGDERDTIIFSIGYGKDDSGHFRYNFGPLQQSGGERRLNVAISRAKNNLKVVASFTPDEIDLSRIESDGVRLFKRYLEFAYFASNNKILTQESTNDGLKAKVANFIKLNGYDVVLDYGYSSFKIDIAVVDKEDNSKFVLAILLDNDTYLNEATCKDRDVLKKEILMLNGWKVYRVYSKFYIENEKEENINLLKAINSNYVEETKIKADNDLSKYVEEINQEIETIDYGFDTFTPFDYSTYLDSHISIEGTLLSINENLVKKVLQTVGVMHLNDLINQIANAFKVGEHRAKNRVLRIINDEDFVRDRMFVYLKGSDTSKVKKVKGNYKRTLEYIYPLEVKNCLLTLLDNSIGLTRDGLIREAMIIFGQKSKSSRVNDFFNVHIQRLLNDKEIKEIDGMLSINKGGEDNG